MQGDSSFTLHQLFTADDEAGGCFDWRNCSFRFKYCSDDSLHPEYRYTDSSAAWVLIAAIIVFFMKAGLMLLEVSFAKDPKDRRYVVLLKHQDAFASAFGFFLLGYDVISKYLSTHPVKFFRITDPVLWFFKFTFASNAATIVGGCLVTNKYKLRIPAAFISAFVISGIIHPIVARIIWSDNCDTLSPYRFCHYRNHSLQVHHNCSWSCTNTNENTSFWDRLYVLDFAGGGAVHLLGGMAGLVICLFAMFQEWRDKQKSEGKTFSWGKLKFWKRESQKTGAIQPLVRNKVSFNGVINGEQNQAQTQDSDGQEERDIPPCDTFWDWMYPSSGGEEIVSEAALGVIILWFCWFAFNCGSAESIEVGFKPDLDRWQYPFYGIPAVIAINMILACASGGTLSVIIAVWAQVKCRAESVNANEIANGVLSALVSITAGCAFVDYWGAVFIGAIGVVLYYIACYLEYKLKIKDTAHVVPVHGMCGLWSVIATGLFIVGYRSHCTLHAAFEGLCYCKLRLPQMNYGERIAAQIIGALIMMGIGLVGSILLYGTLYFLPIAPVNWILNHKMFGLNTKVRADKTPYKKLSYSGGWLLTELTDKSLEPDYDTATPQRNYGSTRNSAIELEETGNHEGHKEFNKCCA